MTSDFDEGGSSHHNVGEGLPTYQTSERRSRRPRDDEDFQTDDNSYGDSSSYDPRATYALQVQRACKTTLQRVKQNNMLANSNWAAPLTAAPTAISVMAFLLKTAADKKAAGLTVASVDVKDTTGKKVVGTLPCVLHFSTVLEIISCMLSNLDSKGLNTFTQICSIVATSVDLPFLTPRSG